MVIDHIDNHKIYEGMHKEFKKKAFDFVKDYIKNEKKLDGRYEISKDVYAVVTSYNTILDSTDFEVHEKYIDGQFIIEGKETINWTPKNNLHLTSPYNEEDDFALYKGKTQIGLKLKKKGDFAIFFPDDAHMPKCTFRDKSELVKKIIIKVKVH